MKFESGRQSDKKGIRDVWSCHACSVIEGIGLGLVTKDTELV